MSPHSLPARSFSRPGGAAGSVYSIGWSGGWEAEVATPPESDATVVKVMHSTAAAGGLCASIRPGEAFRSMRVLAVPFSKAEAPPATPVVSGGGGGGGGGGYGSGGYGGLASLPPSEQQQRTGRSAAPRQTPAAETLAQRLAAQQATAAPLGVPAGGYDGMGTARAPSEAAAPGGYPQVGFNRHRRILSGFKLPRDPRSGQVKGAMVASW